MWSEELDWMEPADAARRLAALPHICFLDSAMGHPTLGRYSYVAADPFGSFRVEGCKAFWNGMGEDDEALTALRKRLARYRVREARDDDLPPFQGGAIGTIAYEYGWTLEGRASPVGHRGDDLALAFYDVVVAFDHVAQRCWLIASGHPGMEADRQRRAEERLAQFGALLRHPVTLASDRSYAAVWRPTSSPDDFRGAVERIKTYIRAGDIYQANISQRFEAPVPRGSDPLSLYMQLRAANPAPFAAFLEQGTRTILSSSPELFLRSDGRSVETRPIKGTAPRHREESHDRAAAEQLLASAKDRAENVMIVDLLRNDLSRVCIPKTVEVPTLCALESYAGVHHLVSQVRGELTPDRDALDLIAASFPGGSITGAPKLRAMEIIAEIEQEPRGIYCGAIGAIGFDGALHLNIAIRTLVIEDGWMNVRTGGGITLLSDPDAEYEETLNKGRRIFEAFAPAQADQNAVA